ncbi:Dihydrolipoamide dehydrogenase [hydrothermal vent metagenome]|uniref:Dihydrolipoamide dehydrogenase n=1 Tax=hydrothermal vent metagenome TaxID=652676 RepID=A0A3B1ACH6_9ZZZZ
MPTRDVEYLIVGGGPGGTPTAMALASAGKSVMLVEQGPGLGGTCLFEGCIPSKIFRESARRLRELNEASDFGLCLPTKDVSVNWSAILQRKRSILNRRSTAALQKSAQLTSLVTCFGKCCLLGPRSATVKSEDGTTQEIHFEKAILSTGSIPFHPPIKGIDHPRVHDSESILNIDHVPTKLVIIGGGPIGIELGQVFNTLGSQITLLENMPRILGPVDEELATRLQTSMQADGIEIITRAQVNGIVHSGQTVFVNFTDQDGNKLHSIADTVLVVTGRRPNVEHLGLENTLVKHDVQGIKVDSELQTGEAGIYAVGDVVGQPMFAHWATAQGLALARHLLGQPVAFPHPNTNSAVIFSEPEIGIAGLTEAQAQQAGLEVAVARYDFQNDARAQIDGRDTGLLKIVFETDTRKIVGVHALVEGAGDLIGEAALLVKAGLPLEAIAGVIHPHPTLTESFVMAVRAILANPAVQANMKRSI